MNRLRRALIASTALPLTLTPLLGAVPSASAAPSCVSIAVLAFRGSGEDNIAKLVTSAAGENHRYGTSALVTNGWEGPRLQSLFDKPSTGSDVTSAVVSATLLALAGTMTTIIRRRRSVTR